MSAARKPDPKQSDALPPRDAFNALVHSANAGDKEAIAQLGLLLDRHPDLWQQVGDLGRNAEMLLILRIAGTDVLTRESIRRRVKKMRDEMYGPKSSAMEKLLIDQFIICWLQMQYVNVQNPTTSDANIASGRFILQQRESAQRQLNAAQAALHTYRKFAPPKLKLREATIPFQRDDATASKGKS